MLPIFSERLNGWHSFGVRWWRDKNHLLSTYHLSPDSDIESKGYMRSPLNALATMLALADQFI